MSKKKEIEPVDALFLGIFHTDFSDISNIFRIIPPNTQQNASIVTSVMLNIVILIILFSSCSISSISSGYLIKRCP